MLPIRRWLRSEPASDHGQRGLKPARIHDMNEPNTLPIKKAALIGIGFEDLLDCAGWLEKKAQQERSLAAQWAECGRKSPHNIEAAEKYELWARQIRDDVAAQSNVELCDGGRRDSESTENANRH